MASTAISVLIGSTIESAQIGYQALPVVFIPQLLLSGFFVHPGLMPSFISWMQYLCPLTYAVRLAIIAEFDYCGVICDKARDLLGADPQYTWAYWLCLWGLFICIRLLSLIILRKKARKFL